MDTQNEQVQDKLPEGLELVNNQADMEQEFVDNRAERVQEVDLTKPAVDAVEPVVEPVEMVEFEGEQIPLSEIDNPKSYKFFQSKFSKTDAELRAAQLELARLKGMTETQARQPEPVKEEAKPPARPQRPQDFENKRLEAMTEPDGQAARELAQYEDSMEAYRDEKLIWEIGKVKQELAPTTEFVGTLKEQEAAKAQQQAYIGEFTKAGFDVNAATEDVNFALSDDFSDPKNIHAYRVFLQGDKGRNPIVDQKTAQYEKRAERTSAPPPGVSAEQPKGELSWGEQQLKDAEKYGI